MIFENGRVKVADFPAVCRCDEEVEMTLREWLIMKEPHLHREGVLQHVSLEHTL